jgi:hypothetical protein
MYKGIRKKGVYGEFKGCQVSTLEFIFSEEFTCGTGSETILIYF